jgi:glutathione S-transferase
MKLYRVPGSRSCCIVWLVEELGLDCEIEEMSLTDGSLRTDETLALNPLARVPIFEDRSS